MAQYSMPWADGEGDGGPYSAEAWDDIFEVLFTTQNADTEGVVKGYKGELAVTGTASPVTVAAGAALVKGKFYVNSDAVQVSVPTPTGSTRYDRIVLQADYSARTVRIVRLEGSEGGSAPSLTQTDGTKWEISLAQLEVHTDGSLVVTDQRAFAHIGTMISPEQIEDGAGSGLDADKLDGHDASYFLPATGKAADADKLDGYDASHFLPATDGSVRKIHLKTAVGVVSIASQHGVCYNVTMNDFAFAPNILTTDTGAAKDRFAYAVHLFADGHDHDDTVARLSLCNQTVDRNFTLYARWRYVTASRPPEVFVLLDQRGGIVGMWVSEIDDIHVAPLEAITAQGALIGRLVQVLTDRDLRAVPFEKLRKMLRIRSASARQIREHMQKFPATVLHESVVDIVTVDALDLPPMVR